MEYIVLNNRIKCPVIKVEGEKAQMTALEKDERFADY